MQNHRLPTFFLTNTTTLHQALWLGLTVPDSSISHRWFQTSSTSGRGICLNCSLKGVSSVTFIMCLVEWVQPNSMASNENTLWYLARNQQMASASPWTKNLTHSNPVCQIVSYAFAWQSIWGYEDPGAHHPPPATEPPWVVWALGALQLPWTPGFSFRGSVGKPYSSLPPRLPFCFLTSALCTCFVWWGSVTKSHLQSIRLIPWY